MMKYFGGLVVLLYGAVAFSGWEPFTNEERGKVPTDVRRSGPNGVLHLDRWIPGREVMLLLGVVVSWQGLLASVIYSLIGLAVFVGGLLRHQAHSALRREQGDRGGPEHGAGHRHRLLHHWTGHHRGVGHLGMTGRRGSK